MKYAVLKVTDGNYAISSEWANLNSAIADFHNLCRLLWLDADTTSASVMIVDENLDAVMGYKEHISHITTE